MFASINKDALQEVQVLQYTLTDVKNEMKELYLEITQNKSVLQKLNEELVSLKQIVNELTRTKPLCDVALERIEEIKGSVVYKVPEKFTPNRLLRHVIARAKHGNQGWSCDIGFALGQRHSDEITVYFMEKSNFMNLRMQPMSCVGFNFEARVCLPGVTYHCSGYDFLQEIE